MKNKWHLLIFISLGFVHFSYAQLAVAGKGIIGGSGTPEDQFQVNGDMQLEEPSPFLRFKSTNNTNAGLNWKNSLGANVGAFFLDPLSGNIFLDVDDFSTTGAGAEFTFAGNGALGIGFNNPQAPLHVLNSASELLRLESPNSNKWIGFYRNGARTGRLISEAQLMVLEAESASGALQLRTAGTSRLTIENDGDLLGNTTTRLGTYTLAHPSGAGSSTGFTLFNNAGGGNYWNLYVVNSEDDLQLFHNGTFKGEFSATDGSYTSVSDRKYKRNIRSMETVLGRIRQLSPKTYQMQEDKTGRQHIGFIAQEVAPLFPELVHQGSVGDSGERAYTMNYGAMAVVAIKGIQELAADRETVEERSAALQKEVEDLQRENRQLADRLNTVNAEMEQLRNLVHQLAIEQESCCQEHHASASDPGVTAQSDHRQAIAVLRQNQPNPFRETTRIDYFIPDHISEAFIQIVDGNGRIWKKVELEATGEGQLLLDTRELPPGSYAYSLFADGQWVGTRQMLLVR